MAKNKVPAWQILRRLSGGVDQAKSIAILFLKRSKRDDFLLSLKSLGAYLRSVLSNSSTLISPRMYFSDADHNLSSRSAADILLADIVPINNPSRYSTEFTVVTIT